jgi:hypothetical protein
MPAQQGRALSVPVLLVPIVLVQLQEVPLPGRIIFFGDLLNQVLDDRGLERDLGRTGEQEAFMKGKRNRGKHRVPFEERLERAAGEARQAAEKLPHGQEREALLTKARQAEVVRLRVALGACRTRRLEWQAQVKDGTPGVTALIEDRL